MPNIEQLTAAKQLLIMKVPKRPGTIAELKVFAAGKQEGIEEFYLTLAARILEIEIKTQGGRGRFWQQNS